MFLLSLTGRRLLDLRQYRPQQWHLFQTLRTETNKARPPMLMVYASISVAGCQSFRRQARLKTFIASEESESSGHSAARRAQSSIELQEFRKS